MTSASPRDSREEITALKKTKKSRTSLHTIFEGNAAAPAEDDEDEFEDDTRVESDPAPASTQQDDAVEPAKETREQAKARKKAAAELAVIKRAQKILGATHQDPVSARELIEAVAKPPVLVADKAEDLALSWLTLITNNFNGGFKTDHIAFVSISAALDETSDAMLLPQHPTRMRNLSQSHAATRTETYLVELLYKMETIKFATEWQKQTGPGALASKAKYNTELFQRENIAIFRDLSNWQKKTKMEEYSTQFSDQFSVSISLFC
ncbi:hypothetical protein B0H14DRAFT_2610243 [Mycena olivaceomarginata]|nr:hypothetical protein B0H14DRAFT_2610243 [Mycena olivaceomarginata]